MAIRTITSPRITLSEPTRPAPVAAVAAGAPAARVAFTVMVVDMDAPLRGTTFAAHRPAGNDEYANGVRADANGRAA
jgi:hypothetical protein